MGKKRLKKIQFDTQPQLTRLHGLVQRIQRGDYPSRKILAAEWEKTARTIQSDLDFIRNVWGLPLEYDPYKYGYYFSEPVGKFPMVPLSERELVSVFVAQKALSQYHGTPFEQPLKSAFEKLVSSLKGEVSVAWADLDSAISFRGIETNAGDVEVLGELSAAIRSRNEIEFEYFKLGAGEIRRPKSEGRKKSEIRNPKGEVEGVESRGDAERTSSPQPSPPTGGEGERPGGGEMRRVRPYHLACVGNQWYLFAYDLMRQDMRKFVPARMRHLAVRSTRFERPKGFSIDKLLKGSFSVFSGGEVFPIRIWFDRLRAQLIRERKWHHSQAIKELGNGEIELSLELSSLVEVVPWILSWGIYARAVAPEALVREVAGVVGRLRKVYGGREWVSG
jgi:proteasome accessory factor B